MKREHKIEVAEIVGKLFADGKTPSYFYGINGDDIERIEQANPHVCKQYPWPTDALQVA